MNQFEYLAVLVSVITGLGVVHLLAGVSKFIGNRRRCVPYWIHLLWTFNVLHYLIYLWWFVWRWSALGEWNLLLYLFVLLYAISVYLLCAVLYPVDDERRDFREVYYQNSPQFFGLWIVVVVIDIIDTRLKMSYGLSGFGGFLVFVWATIAVASAICARSTRPWVHGAWAIGFLGLMSLFEYLNFSALRSN